MAGALRPWPLLPLLLLLAAAVAADDASALLRFKASLGNATALANWAAGTDPCPGDPRRKWVGVLCSNRTLWGLQLENMGLTGVVDVEALVALPRLRTISVARNNFAGSIPQLSRLPALKSIYLSRNDFSGEIPAAAFARMVWLKKLHLSHNRFTGDIPASLAAAPRLLVLRLDDNGFSGRIPDFRQKGLKLFNVSYNQLEGPIPAALSKFDVGSFSDNGDLCGPPLENGCKSPKKIKKMSTTLVIVLIIIGVVLTLAVVGGILAVFLRRQDSSEADAEAEAETGEGKPEEAQERPPAAERKHRHHHPESGKLAFVGGEGRERFDLQDLLRASAEVLRSGNFGSSYKAVLLSGPALVVKRYREMNAFGREDFQEHMRRLGRLKHPNLLPLLAFYYRKEEKLLVTDFVDQASLVQSLHGNRSPGSPVLNWPTRLRIVKGVARGLHYLSSELPTVAVPHGHLKSSNVLLGANHQPLLTDYGLLPVMSKDAKLQMVAFQSPEFLQQGLVNRKSDVWSFGILILEILTGKFPANFLSHSSGGAGAGAGADLAGWVSSAVRDDAERVFDKDMEAAKSDEGEMMKLLHIGLGCCEEDVEQRLEMVEALERIDALRGADEEEDAILSSDGEVYSSARNDSDSFFSFTN